MAHLFKVFKLKKEPSYKIGKPKAVFQSDFKYIQKFA